MFKLLVLFARKPGLIQEEFLDHYENRHVPLIPSLVPAPPVYKRNYMRSDASFGLAGDPFEFDVVAEQVFFDRSAFKSWLGALYAPDNAARVHADEERFLDRSRTVVQVVEERVTADDLPRQEGEAR